MASVDRDSELVEAQVSKIAGRHRIWLKENFRDAGVREILKADTLVFDRILKMAFPVFGVGMVDRMALVAVGSYGREEVCPHSDLDLLILHQDLPGRKLEEFSGRLLGLLWDQKIQVGHSIRTIEQCLKLCEKDYSVLTSLLDARLVAGSRPLFQELIPGFEKLVSDHKPAYFSAKLEEREARQLKYRKEIWLTEPHLMEGTGGLRDWHLIKWLSQACLNLEASAALEKMRLAEKPELRAFHIGLGKLFKLRVGLHLLTGEKSDHLRIEYQTDLARMLGIKPAGGESEADALLADAFSGAEQVAKILDRLVWELNRKLAGGKMDLSSPDPGELKERVKKYFSSQARGSAPVMEILSRDKASMAIQELKKQGWLKRELPELDSAFHLGQRDGYHIYTVGWHSLRCLERMEELGKKPEFGDDPEINWPILKLAGLIHDLGKGSGSARAAGSAGSPRPDHLKAGAGLARKLGKRFRLGADTEQLEFLVSEHLLLNHYAQRRDFYEPKASEHLIRKIKDSSRLKMLYLLTCADIQAVSDTSWTSWKAELLRALYHWLLAQMEKRETPSLLVKKRIQEISGLLQGRAIDREMIRELEKLPTRYLLGARPEKLIAQMKLVEARGPGESIIELKTLEKPRLELSVICDDRPGLFSELSGVLSALNYNILSAEINTLKANTVLDIFLVEDLVGARAENWGQEAEARTERLQKALREAIEKKIPVPELVRKKRGIFRPKSHLEICPEVQADQESSDDYTILEVQAQDQPGLLYKITRTIFKQELDIHFAKISTRSEKVFDVFYLRDPEKGGKAGNEKISQLVNALYAGLADKKPNQN